IAYLAKVTSARQAEFLDRGQRSLDEAKRTGVYVPAEEVIARLQRKLDDATARFLEQRVPAPLMAAAIEVFGGESTAVEWFMKPAMGLDRARPIDLLGSQEGMQAVRDFPARLDGGVYVRLRSCAAGCCTNCPTGCWTICASTACAIRHR